MASVLWTILAKDDSTEVTEEFQGLLRIIEEHLGKDRQSIIDLGNDRLFIEHNRPGDFSHVNLSGLYNILMKLKDGLNDLTKENLLILISNYLRRKGSITY